jgi:hypothetical protein
MSEKRWSIKSVFEWSEHVSLLREWVWPLVPAAIAAAAGYSQSLPIMWIVMATALTAMGTVVSGLAVMMYLERRNPVNKLQNFVVF